MKSKVDERLIKSAKEAESPMKGLWNTLTEEQKKTALDYDGPIELGDRNMK